MKAPQIDPAAPGIVRRAQAYQRKLVGALAIAGGRGARRDPVLAALYASAEVKGVDVKLRMKKSTVTFTAPPFRGGYHQIYDWSSLDAYTSRELADLIDWSLRESMRRWKS